VNTGYSPDRVAAGAVRVASARLADGYPFHARVLEKFRVVPSPAVGTMGVTATVGGVLLAYNPGFVLGLTADELGGVLLHEVHHVVLGHLGLDPADFPDAWAFVVACEVSVNEFVTLPLPGGAIRLGQFPHLPPMESTAARYDRLARTPPTARFALSGAGGVTCPGGDPAAEAGELVDNHAVWAAGDDPAAVREAVAALLNEAAAEAGGVPPELRDAVRAVGRGTAGEVYVLAGGREGVLDWRRLLRHYLGRSTRVQGSYARPPRRFPEQAGVTPGRLRRPDAAAVVAVLDTSGSVDEPTIEAIDGELRRIARTREVVVVEADCVIHRVYPYRTRLECVQGRGGTDFRPALAPEFLGPLRPEVIVYFTDGVGEAPAEAPGWPLIWCLVPGGRSPAPYGRVIHMTPPDGS
jgi:predicted metal-dependent peptidase